MLTHTHTQLRDGEQNTSKRRGWFVIFCLSRAEVAPGCFPAFHHLSPRSFSSLSVQSSLHYLASLSLDSWLFKDTIESVEAAGCRSRTSDSPKLKLYSAGLSVKYRYRALRTEESHGVVLNYKTAPELVQTFVYLSLLQSVVTWNAPRVHNLTVFILRRLK